MRLGLSHCGVPFSSEPTGNRLQTSLFRINSLNRFQIALKYTIDTNLKPATVKNVYLSSHFGLWTSPMSSQNHTILLNSPSSHNNPFASFSGHGYFFSHAAMWTSYYNVVSEAYTIKNWKFSSAELFDQN